MRKFSAVVFSSVVGVVLLAGVPGKAAPSFAQQGVLGASHPREFDLFGATISISGDIAVVGSQFEDSTAVGINGDPAAATDRNHNSGAAYIFVREGTDWVRDAYLKAPISQRDGFFGFSVAVSGNTVVVGEIRMNQAHVFVREGTEWKAQAILRGRTNTALGHESFGHSVAISGDTIVVGASGDDSTATGVNGDESRHGAPVAGAAYVFVREGSAWRRQAYLKASNAEAGDVFGHAVAISGDTLVVGAEWEGGDGSSQQNNDQKDSGAAYVFHRSGGTWSQQAYLKANQPIGTQQTETGLLPGDQFGHSVAISRDTIIVGANRESWNGSGINPVQNEVTGFSAGSGAAYIFQRTGTTWGMAAYLKPPAAQNRSAEFFGNSVGISGDVAVVGYPGERTAANGSGAVLVYLRTGARWEQLSMLKSSDPELGDAFGSAVGISGNSIAVGASSKNRTLGATIPATGLAYVFNSPVEPQPEIIVEEPLDTNLADGDTRFFGNVALGSSSELTFAIGNIGAAPLRGIELAWDGPNPEAFDIFAGPTVPGRITFTVRFTPGSAGLKTSTLRISNNDPDENPFDIILRGRGGAAPVLGAITATLVPQGRQLTMSIPAGETVVIEYSQTLAPGSWTPVGAFPSSGTFIDSDPGRLADQRGFYRATLR